MYQSQENKNWIVTFNKLPTSVEMLCNHVEGCLKEPYQAAALVITALCLWPENKDMAIEMVNYLQGPEALSKYKKQFITERLRGKEYLPYSFFKGSSPFNDYKPTKPYTIEVIAKRGSFAEENYAKLYLQSSGTDSLRPVTLRKKASTGKWFITDQMLLSDIRQPESKDPWS